MIAGEWKAAVFVAAMLAGMALHAWISGELPARKDSSSDAGAPAADPR